MYYVIHNRGTGEIHVYESGERMDIVRVWCDENNLDLIGSSHRAFDASVAVRSLDPLLHAASRTSTHGVQIRDESNRGRRRRKLQRLIPHLVKFDVGDETCEGNASTASIQTLLDNGYTPLMVDGVSCYCAPPGSGTGRKDASPLRQGLQGQSLTD